MYRGGRNGNCRSLLTASMPTWLTGHCRNPQTASYTMFFEAVLWYHQVLDLRRHRCGRVISFAHFTFRDLLSSPKPKAGGLRSPTSEGRNTEEHCHQKRWRGNLRVGRPATASRMRLLAAPLLRANHRVHRGPHVLSSSSLSPAVRRV